MSINWRTTANQLQVFAKASVKTAPDSNTFAVDLKASQVVALLAALESAGTAYEQSGIDGSQNHSTLAAAVRLWWNGGFTATTVHRITTYTPVASASAAWAELDRFARYVYSSASPSDKATAASAFGVTDLPPAPLPPDVTGGILATLSARVTAALAMSSVSATVLGLLTAANTAWTTILAAAPGTYSQADSLVAALQTALTNANAWIAAQRFE